MWSIIDKGLSRAFRFFLISAAIVSLFVTAEAARFTVRVNNSSNAPVSGANACYINSDTSNRQSKTTNSQGEAVFDNVPQGVRKVVASRNGFLGAEREVTLGSTDRTEVIILQVGTGGPACDTVTPPPSPTAVLTIQVSRQNGSALADAVVCLSVDGSGGAKATDSQGRAVFEGAAPPLPFTFRLVVLKQGFQHVDQQVTVNSLPLQQSVTLLEGSSTPPSNISCAVLSPVPVLTTLPSINITNFKVNGGSLQTTTDRTVTLTATFSRTPGFYRVGETRDLSNRPWLAFNPSAPTTYRLNLVDERGVNFGVRQVYFQAAPTAATASVSNLVVSPVILAPAQTSRRTLTGTELLQFLSRAGDAGYRFTLIRIDRQLFEGSQRIAFNAGCSVGVRDIVADILGLQRYEQKDEFKVFSGPSLNAFWKISNVEISAPTGRPSSTGFISSNSTSTITGISGGVSQGLQQIPQRVIAIASRVSVKSGTFNGRLVCLPGLTFQISLNTPTITSIVVEGPSNLDVRNALPPPN